MGHVGHEGFAIGACLFTGLLLVIGLLIAEIVRILDLD